MPGCAERRCKMRLMRPAQARVWGLFQFTWRAVRTIFASLAGALLAVARPLPVGSA